jgi:hypothetical protein
MLCLYCSHRIKDKDTVIIYINNCCYSQSFILDYSDMILTHHTTSSSLDCLSMIVESIDPTKLINSSNNQCC